MSISLGLALQGYQCSSLGMAVAGYQCPELELPPFVIIDLTDTSVCGDIKITAADRRLAVFFNGELLQVNRDYSRGPGLAQIMLYRVVDQLDKITVRRL